MPRLCRFRGGNAKHALRGPLAAAPDAGIAFPFYSRHPRAGGLLWLTEFALAVIPNEILAARRRDSGFRPLQTRQGDSGRKSHSRAAHWYCVTPKVQEIIAAR